MPTLNDIEHEILNALTALDGAELDDEARAAAEKAIAPYLEQLVAQEQRKVDAIAFIDRKAQAEIDFLKDEEERIRRRRKTLESRREQFRSYLQSVMLKHGLKRIVGRESSLCLRRVSRVVIEGNPQHLPEELVEVRIEYMPRKDAIKAALRDGQDVPGATLSESETVVIR